MQEVLAFMANGTTEQLLLWGEGPKWEHSTVPLMKPDGSLMDQPNVGRAGHAIRLNGKQVSISMLNKSSAPGRSACWQNASSKPANVVEAGRQPHGAAQ